jgi:hypothetical protein
MGCGYDFACKTCRKSYYLGYGSYSSWMTWETLEEFDAAPVSSGDRALAKNKRIRECLTEHVGHDHFYVGWDWTHEHMQIDSATLCSESGSYGACEEWVSDWGDWERIDLEERDEKAG